MFYTDSNYVYNNMIFLNINFPKNKGWYHYNFELPPTKFLSICRRTVCPRYIELSEEVWIFRRVNLIEIWQFKHFSCIELE